MIALITQRGAIKKMKRSEFEMTSRAKRGVVMLRELKKNPHRVTGIEFVNDVDTIVILSEKGMIEEVASFQLRPSDRYSNGSFFMDEGENGPIVETWVKTPEVSNS